MRGTEREGASQPRPVSKGKRGTLLILAFSLLGIGVSGYLWSAKIGSSQLICGPVGDCATVNSSPYSEIFGWPVASFGTAMYVGLFLLASLLWIRPKLEWPRYAGFTLALAGAIFSLYLTALEAFVIHAYCVWCVVSWILVTTLAIVWGREIFTRGS